jgi:hypothetical protein
MYFLLAQFILIASSGCHSELQGHFCKFRFLGSFVLQNKASAKIDEIAFDQQRGSAIVQRFIVKRERNCLICIIDKSTMNCDSMTTAPVRSMENTHQYLLLIQFFPPIKTLLDTSNDNPGRKDCACMKNNFFECINNRTLHDFLSKRVNFHRLFGKSN